MEMTLEQLKALVKESADAAVAPLMEKQAETENKLAEAWAKREEVKVGGVSAGCQPSYDKVFGISKEAAEQTMEIARALIAGDLARVKLVTGTASGTGGALLPTEVANVIMNIAPTFGVARQYSTIWPMTEETVDVPKQIANLNDYWVGESDATNQYPKGTGAQPNLFGKVTLTAKAHGVLIPITEKMIRGSSPNVVNFLITEMARALGKGTDDAAFNGKSIDGAVNITGIRADGDLTAITLSGTGQNTYAGLTVAAMDSAIAAVDSDTHDGAAFYCNAAVLWGVIAGLVAPGSTIPVYHPGTDGKPGTYRGFPVRTTSALSGTSTANTDFIVFGNLRYVLLGQREEVRMDTAREATIVQNSKTYNLWQMGIQALKVEEDIDLRVVFGTAFSKIKTAASAT